LSHIPDFEGDDLKRLAAEINKARLFLGQSINFAKLFDKKEDYPDGEYFFKRIFILLFLSIDILIF